MSQAPKRNELSQLSIGAAKITRLTRRLSGNDSDYTSEGNPLARKK
jgi:hypothetical protein